MHGRVKYTILLTGVTRKCMPFPPKVSPEILLYWVDLLQIHPMQEIEWFSASKGSFKLDGSWEQAQSRNQRQDGTGKRRWSESPRSHRDKNRDNERRLAPASEAVGGAAPRKADKTRERKTLAGDRHRNHGNHEGLARPWERSGEEGARHATWTERDRDLVQRGSGRDGVPEHGGPEAVGRAAPREAVER